MAREIQNPTSFAALVKKRSLGPAYILAGEDTQAIERLFSLVRKELIPAGAEDFNLEVMHAESDAVTAAEIITAAETVPFMGGFRVVWVKHAEELLSAELEAIADFLKSLADQPRSDVLLVLTFGALDKRTKFAKAVYKLNAVVECAPGELRNVAAYVKEEYGKQITPSAVALIDELAGGDARAACNEIEKVCTYIGERDTVTETDVADVCFDSAARNEWELADRILQGDLSHALEALVNIRQAGVDVSYQHAIIATAISRLPAARAALRDGTFYKRWAEFRVSYKDPKRAAIERHLRSLTDSELASALSWLMYMDIGVKGGNLPASVLTDIACLKSCVGGEQ